MRRLQESAVLTNISMPLLSKHLKGYVPNGRQIGIPCNKFLADIDHFTETKVIHNGMFHYRRPRARNDNQGAAAVSTFQALVRNKYIKQLKDKDKTYFGTGEGVRGPPGVVIPSAGLQTHGFWNFRRVELESQGLRRDGGGIWSGTPWHVHSGIDAGRSQSGVDATIHGTNASSMARLCKLDPRQDQVRWNRNDGYQHSDQARNNRSSRCRQIHRLVENARNRCTTP